MTNKLFSNRHVDAIMRKLINLNDKIYIIVVFAITVGLLAIAVPTLLEICETMTTTGTVRVENTLGKEIVIEDKQTRRQLARIKPSSDFSFQFGLADCEDGRSITTFRIGDSGGRWVKIESKIFLDHCAEVRDHGVDLRATAGKEARKVTRTIEWKYADNN